MMIDKERLLEQFRTLVSIDSESFHENAMRDYLKKKLQDLGLEVFEDNAGEQLKPVSGRTGETAGNLYGYLKGSKAGEPVLFASHMDTVKPGNGKKAVFHEDGLITSDGTTVLGADDAAGLAEILEMLTVIQEQHLSHPDLEIIFPVAEEPYARGSAYLDYERIHARMAYVLDDSGPIGLCAPAAPAIIQFTIDVKGRAAHAGFNPETGINAIAIMAKAVSEIPQGHVDEVSTLNLGMISGGTAKNIVPDAVHLEGEIRSMDNARAEHWKNVIVSAFDKVSEEYSGKTAYSFQEMFPAYRTKEDEGVSLRYKAACERLGIPCRFEDTFGGSDNNHLAEHDIRGLVIACGMNNCHTTQEWTRTDDLVKAAELILELAIE